MSLSVMSEDFWGCELSSQKKTFEWEYPKEEELGVQHKLFVSQATLGPEVKADSRNVVQVSCKSGEKDISFVIASLKIGLLETINLNLGFTDSVTFKLVSGDGPVHVVGSHLRGSYDDEMDDDESDEEDVTGSLVNGISDEVCNGIKQNKKPKAHEINQLTGSKDDESLSDDDSDEEDEDEAEGEDSDEESDEDSSDEDSAPSKKKKHGILKAKDIKQEKADKRVKFSIEKGKKSGETKKGPLDLSAIKASLSKMKNLPKTQPKFANFLKSNLKVSDQKMINDTWLWYSKNKLSQ